MTASVVLPLVVLAVFGWVVPWGLGKLMPEGIGWLVAIGVVSAAVLLTVSGVGFFWLYGRAGSAVLRAAPIHFAILALQSALVWGPVMALSLANLPRGWKDETW